MTGPDPFNDDQIHAGWDLIDALAEAHELAPDREDFYAVLHQLDTEQLRAIAVGAVVDRIEQLHIDETHDRWQAKRDEVRRRREARWTRAQRRARVRWKARRRDGRRGGEVDE